MKVTSDNTMDLLLRRHAQGTKHVSGAGEGSAGQGHHDHLDPDEMNAFAENALPEAARARFASHLADCDSCRKLATELTITSAVGPRTQPEAARQSFLGFLGQMFAGLFSLPLLRFGVPALAIFLLVFVAFIALRRPRGDEFVAQTNPDNSAQKQERPSITASPESPSTHAIAPIQKAPDQQKAATSEPVPEVAKEKGQASDLRRDSPGYAGAANTVNTTQPGFAPEPKATVSEREEKAANAPTAVAPAKSAPSDNFKLADKSREEDSARKAGNEGVVMQKDEQIGKRNRDVGPAQPPKLGMIVAENRAKGPQRSREQSESEARSSGSVTARRSDAAVETRKVSGRTFRRQGNTWVDTAYNSSMSVTNLSRGSEQYRSFTEDDSGLRAIGEQLGNVIVVWKGKAYRIH